MDAYIIIGNPSVGKSSLIRALSGCRNSDDRLIQDVSSNIFKLWAKDTSLQECRMLPLDFINQAISRGTHSCLFALRAKGCKAQNIKYPDAEEYIDALNKANWNIKSIVILDDGVNKPKISGHHFPVVKATNSRQLPFNILVNSVRTHFHWS